MFTKKGWKFRLIAAGAAPVRVCLYIGLLKLLGEKAQYEAPHSGRKKNAEGKITRKGSRAGRHSVDYLVKCQFRDAKGRLHGIENEWYSSRWRAATTGQAVQVRYPSDHPEQGMREEALEMIKPVPQRQGTLLVGTGLFKLSPLRVGVKIRPS